ncbi:protein SSUH2 homolog [Callorhinchus milii]|uniref:protein SSUH2 homolog n=1 Tax=Callorhinchus milii TaxID=7868 RepID=UPI001C3FCD3B|nr:protein SSUH2 homolog [Callorhinchus milii]
MIPDQKGNQKPIRVEPSELLTENEIRKILLAWVKRRMCLKNKVARRLIIMDIKPSLIVHYFLDTFVEHRSIHYCYDPKPPKGTLLPPGSSLKVWNVPCFPNAMFTDEIQYFVLPNSEEKGLCSECNGTGSSVCQRCVGKGKIDCRNCFSFGLGNKVQLCSECTGNRFVMCNTCNGVGLVPCTRCSAKGKVWYFIQLKVQYINHQMDKLISNERLALKVALKAKGEIVYTHTADILGPINTCSIENVNITSNLLVNRSQVSWPDTLILQQRHTLKVFSSNEVFFTWKNFEGHFWIYDKNHRVHFKQYPQKMLPCLLAIDSQNGGNAQ